MKVKVLCVGPIGTNCYILEDEEAKVAAVIDPGEEADKIAQVVKEDGMALEYILLTHGHYDHTTGVPGLAKHYPDAKIYYYTTKARARHTDVIYEGEVYLMFGPESRGLPEELLLDHPDSCVRIPMLPTLRSLNLSNSVAIAAYEVLRQWDFDGMQTEGQLHHHLWEESDNT